MATGLAPKPLSYARDLPDNAAAAVAVRQIAAVSRRTVKIAARVEHNAVRTVTIGEGIRDCVARFISSPLPWPWRITVVRL